MADPEQIRPNQMRPGNEADTMQTIGGEAAWAPNPAVALDDLTDVDLTGQADGDFLQRVAGVWVPVDPPVASRYEVLMSSDGTATPVTNSAGDDWLYGLVT